MLSQTMGNELLVSVIVPVYNAERFVGRCIESIVGQTYGHIEVILVDDGSTDGSPAICDQWAERDARIQVVHKHNEGAGLARNVGLGRALGSYVCFVDADDYLCLDAIERMLDAVTGRSTDLVFFGFSDVDEQGTLLESHVPTPPHTFYEGREIVLDVLPHAIAPDYAAHSDWNIRLTLWGKLYRRDVLSKVKWRIYSEKDVLSEDVCSLLELFPSLESVAFVRDSLYFYRENATSLSRNYLSAGIGSIDSFYEKCEAIAIERGLGGVVINRLKYPYLSYLVAALKQLCISDCSISDKRREVLRMCDSKVLRRLSKEGFGDLDRPRAMLVFCLSHRLAVTALVLTYCQIWFR